MWDCLSDKKNLTAQEIVDTCIDTGTEIPLKRQAELLGIGRSSIYYTPVPVSSEELELLNRTDKIHTDAPYYGARKIAYELTEAVGYPVGRKRSRTLMRKLGIEALYPKRRLSIGNKSHKVYPYLLSGVTVKRPDQVWSADITYIRMRGGYLYLVAFIDWYSRYILSWELSNSLQRTFCIEAAETAKRERVPEIINFDQGVQFTHEEMVALWLKEQVQISMDHRGRCFDNIFIERFWRSLKYEEVYIKDYQNGIDARESIKKYINRYNTKRIHQALGYKTPESVYLGKK